MVLELEERHDGRDRQNRPPRKGHSGESKAEKRRVCLESDTVNRGGGMGEDFIWGDRGSHVNVVSQMSRVLTHGGGTHARCD